MTAGQRKTITISLLVIVTALLILWDIFVAIDQPSGGGTTISEVTLGFAQRHPALPFAVGVVCGHLFWPQRAKPVNSVN